VVSSFEGGEKKAGGQKRGEKGRAWRPGSQSPPSKRNFGDGIRSWIYPGSEDEKKKEPLTGKTEEKKMKDPQVSRSSTQWVKLRCETESLDGGRVNTRAKKNRSEEEGRKKRTQS